MRTDAGREALGVLAEAARFFVRHYPVVLAFGAIASIQRFLAVGGDERFAFAGGAAGEVVTAAVRVLFLLWLVRRLFAGERVPWSEVGARLAGFVDRRRPVLWISVAMLVVLTVVAKVIPYAVGAALAEDARSTYLAWELAIKNITVIPFVMIWLTVFARHALLADPRRTI